MRSFGLIAVVLCNSLCLAQGTWESVGPYGGWINDLKEDNSGRLLATTSFGGIYRSADNAESWQQIYTDTLIFDPRSIATNSSGLIFVGSEGIDGVGFLRSTDDGASWEVLPNALSSTGAADLLVTNSGEILACTFADDGLYRSTDGGTTFTAISSFPSSFPTDIEINSSGHLFVGTRFGSPYLYRSTDNGTTWVSIGSGITTDVTDVHVSASDDIYAANAFGVYKSTNSGDNWTNLNAPNIGYTSVVIVPNGNIYASFYGGIFDGGIHRSTDDGATWTQDSGLPIRGYARLLSTSGGMLFVGGQGHGVYRRMSTMSSSGTDWEQKVSGMVNTFITSIAQDSISGYLYAGTGHVLVFRSTDFGLTWQSAASGIPDYEWINSVTVNVDGAIFASGVYGGIYRSTDQGNSWTNVYVVAATTMACNTQGHVFAGLGNRVYRSTDNGDSWTSAILSSVQKIAGIAFDGDTVYVATGTGSAFGTSRGVYRSTDNGNSWEEFNNGLTNLNVTTIVVREELTANASGPQCRISCGTWGSGVFDLNESGTTWINNISLLDREIVSMKKKLTVEQEAALEMLGCKVFRALDWLDKEISALNESSDGDWQPIAFVGTSACGIYRSENVITGVETGADIPQSVSLEQNYPNPFNPQTEIGFRIPETGHVTLTVYDLLGRKISTLVNESKSPGSYTVTWDASGHPSGVYFYRLSTNDFVQTRKLVLLR